MDDIFDEIDYSSNSDSIVMGVLRSAMDRAHEKVQCKDGPIGFLHERSKFYEVAAILVDAGLNIVQEETDILESSREKIRLDLMEIEHWLHGRIKQMKLLIVDKDKELKERVENEVKLRQALELKEKELVFLRAKKKLERSKSESFREYIAGNQSIQDEAKEGNFRELKYSLDQQVLDIKQKLADERKSLETGMRDITSYDVNVDHLDRNELSEKEKYESIDFRKDDLPGEDQVSGTDSVRPEKVVIQQMSSDIDILKGTLDLAFGRMQKAEVLPLEKQWRWIIEKDIISILIRGFIDDIQRSVEAELTRRENHISIGFLKENWTELRNELTNLREELQAMHCRTEGQMKMNNVDGLFYPPPVRRTSSEPLPGISYKLPEEDSETDGSHYVAKMIKNHESIIRKQHKEWRWLTQEVLRQKESSSLKRERNRGGLERSLQEAITRLDNLIRRNNHMNGGTIAYGDKYNSEERTLEFDRSHINTSCIDYAADLKEEIRNLKEERDYQDMHISIMDEIYLLLFQGLREDIDLELCKSAIDYLAKNDTRSYSNSSTPVDSQHDKVEKEMEHSSSSTVLQHYLESSIREDVQMVFFQEMVREWSERMELFTDESLVKEEMFHIVFNETIKNTESTGSMERNQLNTEFRNPATFLDDLACSTMSPETIENSLKEDVYMVFFRELAKSWKMEIDARDFEYLIREDIYQFVIFEAMKDAHVLLGESEAPSQMKISENISSTTKSDVFDKEESLIEKLDSLLRYYEVEEDLQEGIEMKEEHEPHHDPVISKHENVDELYSVESLLTDDDSTSSSVNEKLERALAQLHTSRALLTDLAYSLGTSADDSQKGDLHNQINASPEVESERKHTFCQLENSRAGQTKPPDTDIVFLPPIEFQQVLVNFEQMAHGKLERNCLRMEELKQKLATLVSPIISIKEKKLLYKKAFLTRCHNLQLAEAEVDLLADQVDRLLHLLEKIYKVLDQNSTVLSSYFGVSDVLKLIKKELANGVADTMQF